MPSFPLDLLSLVRCTRDFGALFPEGSHGPRMTDGRVRCASCDATYHVRQGILDLIGGDALEGEGAREQALRDQAARVASALSLHSDMHQRMEMDPTLEALGLRPQHTLLELGCGDGRYTDRLVGRCRRIVAMDFSRGSLAALGAQLPEQSMVALVLADVTTFRVLERAFDRVFGTLTSNLPSREAREAMYRLASGALAECGSFVYSAHHHGVRAARGGQPKSGHYDGTGIYRFNFTVREAHDEARRHFEDVHVNPIRIYVPFGRLIPLPTYTLSRLAERLPLVNRFGHLVLCRVSHDKGRARWRRLRKALAGGAATAGFAVAALQLD